MTKDNKTSVGTTSVAASDVALEGVTAETARAARKEPRSGSWAATGAEGMACHAVGPIGQKERCTRCGKKGHIAKVCAEAAAARAAFLKNYGKPWELEHNLPNDEEERRGINPIPVRRGPADRDRDGARQGESTFQMDEIPGPRTQWEPGPEQ